MVNLRKPQLLYLNLTFSLMQKQLCSIFLLWNCILLNAQDEPKEIDLTSAVLQQYRKLAPQTIRGFHWVSDGSFLHSNDKGNILIKDNDGETTQEFSLKDVNDLLRQSNLDTLSRLVVADVMNGKIFLYGKNRLYALTSNGSSIEPALIYPDQIGHKEFQLASSSVAYIKGPNVFVKTGNSPEIQVTNHSHNAQVSAGIAIHRSEFGIYKGLFWSENGTRLGFYEMDESPVTNYPLADYTSIPGEVNLIKYPMAGQASHEARVGLYDVLTDTTIYLQTTGPKDQYYTNFTFSPDGKAVYLAIVNRGQNKMKLNRYNAETGAFEKTLFIENNDKYVEPERGPIFLSDGKFLWFSERDGFDHLYLYNADGTLIRQLTTGEFDVLTYHGEVSGGVLLEVVEGLMSEALIIVDLKNGKARKVSTSPSSFSLSFDTSSKHTLVREKSMTVANKVYIIDAKGKNILNLVNADNPLSDYQIGDIELPVINAEDGTKLQCRLIKPYNFDPDTTYPVIVYVYGGPHAQLIRNSPTAGAPLWMFHAANRGYVVFTVDGRGSAHRGLAFEQAIFRNLGDVEMEDQLTGVEYLKSLPYVNTSRMAVHGWSYGGFMTTSLMLRYPEVFDVGVAGGPVTDWNLYEIMYGERYMDTPEENPQGYEKARLNSYVENLEGDLLLIHGLDDDVVVPQHSYALLKSFVDAGVQVDFFTYPGHPHNVRGKDRVHLMTKVLDYIDQRLK